MTTREQILDDLSDLSDGTDTLGVVIDCALADDPHATAADVRAVWNAAKDDWANEQATRNL